MQPKVEENLKNWDMLGAYSRWIYSTYAEYIGRRVLDVGAGVGNMTQFYIEQTDIVICSDIFDSQLEIIKKRFSEYNLEAIKLDIEQDDVGFLQRYKLDTVICINVLEHIENDLLALEKMAEACTLGRVELFFLCLQGVVCIIIWMSMRDTTEGIIGTTLKHWQRSWVYRLLNNRISILQE
jgi:2-polyprenyl-3-methyl-5-hydroxy-6-metoxy-1,4-benzoquinol methylase